MKHVDEGTLHAYLDGAIDALVDAGALPRGTTRAAIEAHLAGCADCRALFEAERAVRDGAHAVLDAADVAVDVPPFESVAGPRADVRQSGLRTLPLAWAASIVVALGAGWWGADYVAERRLPASLGETLQGDAALPPEARNASRNARETEAPQAAASAEAPASETQAGAPTAPLPMADAPPVRTDFAAAPTPQGATTGRAESNEASKAEPVRPEAVWTDAALADAAARERAAARQADAAGIVRADSVVVQRDIMAGGVASDSVGGQRRIVAGLATPDSAAAQRSMMAGRVALDSAAVRMLADSVLRAMQAGRLQEVVVTGAADRRPVVSTFSAPVIPAAPPPVLDPAVPRMFAAANAVHAGRAAMTEAAVETATPLVYVDGAEMIRVESGTHDGNPITRVTQRLETGTIAEVIAWRDAGTAAVPPAAPPAPARDDAGVAATASVLVVTAADVAGTRQLVARTPAGTLVTLRAVLADDELRALARRLRER